MGFLRRCKMVLPAMVERQKATPKNVSMVSPWVKAASERTRNNKSVPLRRRASRNYRRNQIQCREDPFRKRLSKYTLRRYQTNHMWSGSLPTANCDERMSTLFGGDVLTRFSTSTSSSRRIRRCSKTHHVSRQARMAKAHLVRVIEGSFSSAPSFRRWLPFFGRALTQPEEQLRLMLRA